MLHHHAHRGLGRLVAGAAAVGLLLSGCSGDGGKNVGSIDCSREAIPAETPAASGPGSAPPTLTADDLCDQVTYLTAFNQFGRDAFIHCGVDRGYFANRRIEVEIQTGDGTTPNLGLLLAGQVDFALVDMVGGLLALGNDGVGGWRAVAAIHQIDLSTWMTLDPDLQSPSDLEGKTIAMPQGGVIPAIFPTYAKLAGADPDKIEIEFAAPNVIPGLLATGKADAIAQFAVGLPFVQDAVDGQQVHVRPFSDYITDLYGVGLAATDELIADDVDLVRRFRAALLEGLAWALDHPEECAAIAARGGLSQPEPVAAAELTLMEPYVRSGVTFGTFDERRVGQMIATLEAAQAIPPGITPDDIIALSDEDATEEEG